MPGSPRPTLVSIQGYGKRVEEPSSLLSSTYKEKFCVNPNGLGTCRGSYVCLRFNKVRTNHNGMLTWEIITIQLFKQATGTGSRNMWTVDTWFTVGNLQFLKVPATHIIYIYSGDT